MVVSHLNGFTSRIFFYLICKTYTYITNLKLTLFGSGLKMELHIYSFKPSHIYNFEPYGDIGNIYFRFTKFLSSIIDTTLRNYIILGTPDGTEGHFTYHALQKQDCMGKQNISCWMLTYWLLKPNSLWVTFRKLLNQNKHCTIDANPSPNKISDAVKIESIVRQNICIP